MLIYSLSLFDYTDEISAYWNSYFSKHFYRFSWSLSSVPSASGSKLTPVTNIWPQFIISQSHFFPMKYTKLCWNNTQNLYNVSAGIPLVNLNVRQQMMDTRKLAIKSWWHGPFVRNTDRLLHGKSLPLGVHILCRAPRSVLLSNRSRRVICMHRIGLFCSEFGLNFFSFCSAYRFSGIF